jgi:CRISPR/Cas system Type II protein with McrA/HNH and RuvC-like nuclease domain
MCQDCWIRAAAHRHHVEAKILHELWEEQNGLCRYTGEKLIPSNLWDNGASLDHITPLSRGGINGKNNLQWVSYRVNTVKSNMTHDEFVSFCSMIAERNKPATLNIAGL